MHIDRLEIKDMWSFGSTPVVIDDLDQINVLIGKNNAGKSKVLAALRWIKQYIENLKAAEPLILTPDVQHDAGRH